MHAEPPVALCHDTLSKFGFEPQNQFGLRVIHDVNESHEERASVRERGVDDAGTWCGWVGPRTTVGHVAFNVRRFLRA